MGLSLGFLAAMALFAGPALDQWVRGLVGDNRWLRLVALAGRPVTREMVRLEPHVA